MTYFLIKKTGTDDVLFEGNYTEFKFCVEAAVRQQIALNFADLRGANLMNAELDEGCFKGARFDHANLTGANMSESNLEEASFYGAVLYNTCLCEANMKDAQFLGAGFGATDLSYADIRGACFDTSSALDLKFSEVENMDQALYYDRTGVICEMSRPPITIKGLEYPVVLFDQHMKVGSAVLSYGMWRELKAGNNQSMLDRTLLHFIQTYGGFLYVLSETQSRLNVISGQIGHKNVA